MGGLRDLAELIGLLGVGGAAQREGGHAHDGVHRGAQLVAHVGEESALCAVGGFGGVPAFCQFFGARGHELFEVMAILLEFGFGLLARGDVAQHDTQHRRAAGVLP